MLGREVDMKRRRTLSFPYSLRRRPSVDAKPLVKRQSGRLESRRRCVSCDQIVSGGNSEWMKDDCTGKKNVEMNGVGWDGWMC